MVSIQVQGRFHILMWDPRVDYVDYDERSTRVRPPALRGTAGAIRRRHAGAAVSTGNRRTERGTKVRMLVVVCGLPGVGKTTVADGIADRVHGELIRTDVVRKEIFDDPEYTDEETGMVYKEMLERAERTLQRGENVVLDGTFHQMTFRRRARKLAEELDEEFRVVKVECSTDVVKRRIRDRTEDASDADFEIHLLYQDTFDPLSLDYVQVDNSRGLEETQSQLDQYF